MLFVFLFGMYSYEYVGYLRQLVTDFNIALARGVNLQWPGNWIVASNIFHDAFQNVLSFSINFIAFHRVLTWTGN